MALDRVLHHFTHDLQTEAPPVGQMIHFICYHRNPESYSRYSGVVQSVYGENDTRSVRLGPNSCKFVDDGFKCNKMFDSVVLPLDMAPNCKWSDQMLPLRLLSQETVGDNGFTGKDGSLKAGSRKSRRKRKNRKSRRS
jgi:hypothetical protein